MANKVTNIINCAGSQIQNQWESIGVSYLTFNFLDTDEQVFVYVDNIGYGRSSIKRNFQLYSACSHAY